MLCPPRSGTRTKDSGPGRAGCYVRCALKTRKRKVAYSLSHKMSLLRLQVVLCGGGHCPAGRAAGSPPGLGPACGKHRRLAVPLRTAGDPGGWSMPAWKLVLVCVPPPCRQIPLETVMGNGSKTELRGLGGLFTSTSERPRGLGLVHRFRLALRGLRWDRARPGRRPLSCIPPHSR